MDLIFNAVNLTNVLLFVTTFGVVWVGIELIYKAIDAVKFAIFKTTDDYQQLMDEYTSDDFNDISDCWCPADDYDVHQLTPGYVFSVSPSPDELIEQGFNPDGSGNEIDSFQLDLSNDEKDPEFSTEDSSLEWWQFTGDEDDYRAYLRFHNRESEIEDFDRTMERD